MASSRNLLSPSDPNSYGGGDDAFDTYIDMDFLRNDTMEEDIDIGNMSTSDLFRYYLEGELAKDAANLDSETYATTMQNVEDFSLATSPVSVSEEPKPNHIDVVEETNVLPQPTTNVSTAVGPSLAILNAQLAELLAKLPIIKRETIADNKVTMLSGSSTPDNPTFSTLNTASKPSAVPNNNTESDQKQIDDNSQIDLKKLSSKERRQLRNKISARNFRVRRKEYIQSLESTKEQQQEEINLLRQALLHLQEENNKLQQEVEELRKQKQSSKVFANPPPSPPHNSSLTAKDVNSHAFSKNGNVQRSSNSVKAPQNHQPSSPDSRYLIIPNVNKDTSPSSSSSGKKTWQDSRVRVQTTFIPEFNLDKHLFEGKSEFPYSSFWNTATNGLPVRWDPFDIGSNNTSQKALFACMLLSTMMQRITALFIEAVCATPHHLMISALFPKAISTPKTPIEGLQPPDIVEKKASESSETHCQSSNSLSANNIDPPSHTIDDEEPLLDNTTIVESIKEASVLDWLYDSMVKHVVEQSQMEARMTELSDWVGEELDDNVLPYLF